MENEKIDAIKDFLSWCDLRHIFLASVCQEDVDRGDTFPRSAPITKSIDDIVKDYADWYKNLN